MNNNQSTQAANPLRNPVSVSTAKAPAMTAVQIAKDHFALASPNTSAPTATNQTNNVILKPPSNGAEFDKFTPYIVLQ